MKRPQARWQGSVSQREFCEITILKRMECKKDYTKVRFTFKLSVNILNLSLILDLKGCVYYLSLSF